MNPEVERKAQAEEDASFASHGHLTGEEFGELLERVKARAGEAAPVAMAASRADLHVRECAACAEELASLSEVLTLFQRASMEHAERTSGQLRTPLASAHRPRRTYSPPLFWVAASTILMAGLLPLQIRWRADRHTTAVSSTAPTGHPVESDEALLDDINRELSASVPASMQALADPTAMSAAPASVSSTSKISTQRKD